MSKASDVTYANILSLYGFSVGAIDPLGWKNDVIEHAKGYISVLLNSYDM